jgi:hypothetical protein
VFSATPPPLERLRHARLHPSPSVSSLELAWLIRRWDRLDLRLLPPPANFIFLSTAAGIMSSSTAAFRAGVNQSGFSTSMRSQFASVHSFTSALMFFGTQ